MFVGLTKLAGLAGLRGVFWLLGVTRDYCTVLQSEPINEKRLEPSPVVKVLHTHSTAPYTKTYRTCRTCTALIPELARKRVELVELVTFRRCLPRLF